MSSASNRRCLSGGSDHLSNLPDAILCQILCLLSTRCAMRTSVLSKRWKYLWTKVPALDFTDKPSDRNGFLSLVDKVLLHNDVSCLQRLCFDIEDRDDDFLVNSLLNVASRRQVCELNLKVARVLPRKRVPFPLKFLTFERLEVLKLNGWISVDAQVPFCLTNLRTVHLTRIKFLDNDFIKKLLVSSPKLQELFVVGCAGIVSTLRVQSPNLMSLTIRNTLGPSEDNTHYIIIEAPKLRFLHLQEDGVRYVICDLPCLVKATFRVEYDYTNHHTLEVMRKFCEVRSLELTCTEAFGYWGEVPLFQNLTHLELHEADDHIFELLSCVPKLRKLIIESVWWRSKYDDKLVPEFLSELRSVELRSFRNDDEEFSLLSYILESASNLEELKIYIEFTDVGEERFFYKCILRLPRSSPRCQIDIVDLVNNE